MFGRDEQIQLKQHNEMSYDEALFFEMLFYF